MRNMPNELSQFDIDHGCHTPLMKVCKMCKAHYPRFWSGFPRNYGDFCSKTCGEMYEKITARESIKAQEPQ